MNFDLTELAATLAIGVFFLVGAAYAQLLSSGKPLGAALNRLSNTSQYFVAVIMAGCFVVGMILEDLSNKFVDDDWSLNWGLILVSDDEIKSRVFFGNNYRNNIHEEAPLSLSYLAAKYGLLGHYGGADGAALESHILRKMQCQPKGSNPQFQEMQLNKEVSNDVAKLFYYNAKSITYKDESYYNELKKIQMRIDFSRSLIAVSELVLVLFIGGIVVTLLKRWSWLRKRLPWLSKPKDAEKLPAETLNDQSPNTQDSGRKLEKRRMLEFALILVVIFFAANFAYLSEEMEFDKRVYGYYIYHKVNAETPATLICQEPTVIKTLAGTTPQIAAQPNNPNTCCDPR